MSPGSSRVTAWAGVSRSDSTPGTTQLASAKFVGVERWATTANFMCAGMVRVRGPDYKCSCLVRLIMAGFRRRETCGYEIETRTKAPVYRRRVSRSGR